jgi:hypothetical protein
MGEGRDWPRAAGNESARRSTTRLRVICPQVSHHFHDLAASAEGAVATFLACRFTDAGADRVPGAALCHPAPPPLPHHRQAPVRLPGVDDTLIPCDLCGDGVERGVAVLEVRGVPICPQLLHRFWRQRAAARAETASSNARGPVRGTPPSLSAPGCPTPSRDHHP